MATEIERKFLVVDDSWRQHVQYSKRYLQGYFSTNKKCSIRIRISADRANLNIKSATLGITRSEFDYEIPVDDAMEMLEHLCSKPVIEKTRHIIRFGGHEWEIDEFAGDNAGLVVAELELDSPETPYERPEWLGDEVSEDPRYYNVCLVEHPYKNW